MIFSKNAKGRKRFLYSSQLHLFEFGLLETQSSEVFFRDKFGLSVEMPIARSGRILRIPSYPKRIPPHSIGKISLIAQ
jgi:hypothetical protein